VSSAGNFTLQPLGVIHTPHQNPELTPTQPCFARHIRGEIHLDGGLTEGLKGIHGFSHLHLVYLLHQAKPGPLVARPYLTDEPMGVFACRVAERPNTLGLSVVRLLAVEGNRLIIEDVDMLDGSPLLDIKPYYPKADRPEGAWGGWTEEVPPQDADHRGRRQPKHG